MHTTWWLDALHHIEQNKDLSSLLIQKIGEALSGNSNKKSRIPAWLVMVSLPGFTFFDRTHFSRACLFFP